MLSGVISKAAACRFILVIPLFPTVVADWRVPVLVLASIGLIYGSLLAFRAQTSAGDRLLEPCPDEPHRHRALRRERSPARTARSSR